MCFKDKIAYLELSAGANGHEPEAALGTGITPATYHAVGWKGEDSDQVRIYVWITCDVKTLLQIL